MRNFLFDASNILWEINIRNNLKTILKKKKTD